MSITQRVVTLLWLPGIFLLNSCNGGRLGLNPQEISARVGKEEAGNNSIPSEIIVFCGNPGVGKSSLCNSIFQQSVFKSGFSLSRGITQEKQEYTYENRRYIDTPGLADIKLREQAAMEIEKALKENNNYKIVFVALLDSGRIRAADLTTINTVCDAIKAPFEYGIIFNKLDEVTTEAINQGGEDFEMLLADIRSVVHKQPTSIAYIEEDNNIRNKNNLYLSPSSTGRTKLINFISSLKANMILDNNVEHIDVRSFEEQVIEIENKFQEAKKALEEERIQLQKQIEQQGLEQQRLEQQRLAAEQQRIQLQKQIEQQRIQLQKQIEQQQRLEQQRLATEKAAEQQRIQLQQQIEQQKRLLEQQILAAEKAAEQQRMQLQQQIEQQRIQVQKQIEQQQRLEQQRLAAEKAAEQQRIQLQQQIEQQRIQLQKQIEQQQRLEQQRLAAEKKAEEERKVVEVRKTCPSNHHWDGVSTITIQGNTVRQISQRHDDTYISQVTIDGNYLSMVLWGKHTIKINLNRPSDQYNFQHDILNIYVK